MRRRPSLQATRIALGAVAVLMSAGALACSGEPRQGSADAATASAAGTQAFVSSPDGRIAVELTLTEGGEPRYSVTLGGRTLLRPSPLGLVTTTGVWDQDLREVGRTSVEAVSDRYELLHGKCGTCTYEANRRIVSLADGEGRVLEIVFQVSDDGVALRYRIPDGPSGGEDATVRREPTDGVTALRELADSVTARRELTGFRFPEDGRTWLMPMDPPESGWMRVNPAYEAHYVMDGVVAAPSPTGVGWAYPGLFRVPGVGWALVTEAGMDGTYCGSRLRAGSDGLYRVAFPEPGEGTGPDDPVEPSFTLPFASPWRLIIVGEGLGPIVESTLVTDVSAPSKVEDVSFVRPGKAAWSWLPLKDGSIVPPVQRRFVDMAAEQGYPYVLVDNYWDRQIGYDGLSDVVRYASERGVGVFVWYNSNGDYNDAPQTPRDRMVDPEVRRRELRRLREMGVRGIKVDFFGGDKQSVIRHYLAILRDAAEERIMVNVHGATLPRGWSRTWPDFMTAEAVRGYEFITFGQADADLAPSHAAVLPFTRNAVGPMDFTPTMFSDRVGVSIRRTSDAFDLAMNVVFESGLQHLGVTPESLQRVPDHVRRFLAEVPVAWDETRFLDGWPGEFVALARRKGERWYLGGINGGDEPRELELDVGFVGAGGQGTLIADGQDGRSFRREEIRPSDGPLRLRVPPRGGFVALLAPAGEG